MSRDIFNIPDNVINSGIKSYTQDEQDALRWAVGYCRQELDGSRSRICEQLQMDWSTLFKALTGTYAAKLDAIVGKITELRDLAARTIITGHIDTPVTKKICSLLDYALAGDIEGGKMVMIVGRTGRSKTETLKHWARMNNHGTSVMIDCPESGGLKTFMREICRPTGVNRGKNSNEMRDALIKSFHRKRILILDEVARVIPRSFKSRPAELEFVRRLHDTRRCAVAMSLTRDGWLEMEQGELGIYFEQLFGRCPAPLHIPDDVSIAEAAAIVRAFNKQASQDLIAKAREIANGKGKLRLLFEDLRNAAELAKAQRKAMTVDHLRVASMRRDRKFQWNEEDGQ